MASNIGATLFIATSQPASETGSLYAALSYSQIGLIISIGDVIDAISDISYDLLESGRTNHDPGAKDMAAIPTPCKYSATDTGQLVCATAFEAGTACSFKLEDPDGEVRYFKGYVSNHGTTERSATTFKQRSITIQPQSGATTVAA